MVVDVRSRGGDFVYTGPTLKVGGVGSTRALLVLAACSRMHLLSVADAGGVSMFRDSALLV